MYAHNFLLFTVAVAAILQVLAAQVVPAVAPVQGPAAVVAVVAVLVQAVPGLAPVARAHLPLAKVKF